MESSLIREIKKGLLAWYDFRIDVSSLYIGNEEDALAEYLKETLGNTTIVSIDRSRDQTFLKDHQGSFDYIVSVGCLETEVYPTETLGLWKSLLRKDGILLLGVNNRLGSCYICGERDPYTNRLFDGLESYRRVDLGLGTHFTGRCYARNEIDAMLLNAGFSSSRFFSVIPGFDNPSVILKYGYNPKEDLANRIFPVYRSPETVFIEEESIYKSLLDNNIFHQMANGYLVEASCCKDPGLSPVLQATSSMGRSKGDAMLTIIRDDKSVVKKNAYIEGRRRLEEIVEYCNDLRNRGINVIDMTLTDNGLVMPYYNAPTGQLYLKELMQTDLNEFLEKMDLFRDQILKSSDIICGNPDDDMGVTLRYGYLDMVPLNSFYLNGTFVFFDQEFRKERYPANAIISRMIATFYSGNIELEKILPQDELFKRYGLLQRKMEWMHMEWDFLDALRNENELREYHNKTRRDYEVVKLNRERMNYSAIYYDHTFVNIFSSIEGKRLYLFGSGKYADRFLDMYGDDFPVYGMLDNNAEKQGAEKRGIRIYSPEVLREADADSLKVMICMKDYQAVIRQLDDMGVKNYSVYDPNKYYATRPRTSIRIVKGESDDASQTAGTVDYHCHIGYCAGAFDMFHIGHLNLLRRAKERCDYLIVGVMSDEKMFDLKKKYPVIPCNERMQVVAGCRYVDRVEELPIDRAGIMDAYHMFHFDCMFSGDDHVNDPAWLSERDRLRELGSDIVFVSYTKETSSTAIREKMKS